MGDAQVYKAGSPVIKYGRGADDPTLYTPPYGRHKISDTSPPFNAHVNGSSGQFTYSLGCPLKPHELEWQRTNLRTANLGVGDTIQMLVIPVNHWIEMMRFDVNNPDPGLAGATVTLTGQRVRVDPGDPYRSYLVTPEPVITAALAAQSAGPIPLDVPSSVILWLNRLVNAAVTGTIPPGTDSGGGALTGGAADGFVQPLYVEPEFYPNAAGTIQRFETGGLILGIQISTMPTDPNVRIEHALYDFYMTARVSTVSSPSFI
jgi:hypothetical protein